MPRDFVIACGDYSIECTPSGLPALYDELRAHAALAEEAGLDQRDLCCLTVRRDAEAWPFLVIALGCPAAAAGFSPGVLLAGEASALFVGYGERVFAFRLQPVAKIWAGEAAGAFSFWEQHGEVVLLGTGRSLAAWSSAGRPLWTVAVAPPWTHRVRGDHIELTGGDGRLQRFPLQGGPRAHGGAEGS